MITQLVISTSSTPQNSASYVIVGGGGGAVIDGASGLGGEVLFGSLLLISGSYPVIVGAGGSRGGGLGSSSTFMGINAGGSTRTTTVSVNDETFSGQGLGPPRSTTKGEGALSSSIVTVNGFCVPNWGSERTCGIMGGEWTPGYFLYGDGNSGTVILTIQTSFTGQIIATGATTSINGNNTIYKFNSSGSLVVL